MVARFQDKFDRADGDIGTDYLVPCGGVLISDEAVVPIDLELVESGMSPVFPAGVTARKTQVFYNAAPVDSPDYVVRATFAHDATEPSGQAPEGTITEPSFTLLARFSKDPLLFDLGVEEEPLCWDQGYGLRFTFPLDETAPILKIIKYQPGRRIPNLTRPSSVEIDGALVLAEVILEPDDLNLDPDFDVSTFTVGDPLPYRGFWQDARLRIRRADREVILETYLNDRNMNQAKITYTDRQDPLWGVIGLPGFEFLSATLSAQPTGVSPFSLAGLAVLRCGIFSVDTFRDVRRPVRVRPGSEFTYRAVTNRVITLVEKDGDARYNATTNGTTKFNTYLNFVMEAEADIIRKEGYFQWLRRSERLYLILNQLEYELPEDIGIIEIVRPGNWNRGPLGWLDPSVFFTRLGGVSTSGGVPTIYTTAPIGVNNRLAIRIFPVPTTSTTINTSGPSGDEDAFLQIDYFARQLFPDEPDIQIPFVPQEDIDVLIYGAAAHALLLDTDDANAQRFAGVYMSKLGDLRRKNNRKMTQQTILRSIADVEPAGHRSRIPLLRNTQLETLLI